MLRKKSGKNLNKNRIEEIFQDVVHRLLNRFLRISNRKVIKKRECMKAMTRQELAYKAGVDRKTFYRYVKCHADELRAMGMRPRERLPPAVVKWIVDSYGVTLDEE